MIKNRKHGHIGLGTTDIEADVKWYIDVLGFELIGDFKDENGGPIKFIKNNDVVYEIFPAGRIVYRARSITMHLIHRISRQVTNTV